MIAVPAGFNVSALLADFSLFGGGVLGLVFLVVVAVLIAKAVRAGG